MTDPDRLERPRVVRVPLARRAAFGLFFASGAAALIYEVSWSRQIGLRLGQTVQAAGVVLAAYFAGLAIGSAVAARLTRAVRPLVGYGACELLVAAWAALVPTLLELSGGLMA
ncbi:spermidine synthase family protein [Tautonia sociabilis]|uniref:Spermidine synthase n=1 Tax=Tautonia sociabilis TaxID=2080755 RepID=A0A432MPR0_9BACT|nr:hypothetical protein [Tautonia sociabilis]RUL89076.1 hypothetical protein TsocGM_04275 [Tautonia sociabilis]